MKIPLLVLATAGCALLLAAHREPDARFLTIQDPIVLYNNWSSYDELSDNVPLTEQLAMKELDELLRLRQAGVPFDYYMMDAFWYARDGGYRTWRKATWPNGPDRWLNKCRANGLKPGMWFGTNLLVQLDPAPQWEDSLNQKRTAMCFFKGGFLPHFMDTLQFWYDRGVRMFTFQPRGETGTIPEPNVHRTDGPLASLSSARDAIRLRRCGGDARAVKVLVRGGTYFLNEPLVFGPEDSGTGDAPIIYSAYPHERPVISGGRKVDGWHAEGRAWKANSPAKITQLFIDGRRAQRARMPRYGFFRIDGPSSQTKPFSLHYRGTDIRKSGRNPGLR